MKLNKVMMLILIPALLMVGCGANGGEKKNQEVDSKSETEVEVIASEDGSIGELTSFGRASIKLKLNDGRVIYIDPYAGDNSDYEEPADLILVTHTHSDHSAVYKVKRNEDVEVVVCPKGIKSGDTLELKGITVTAVPAYNTNHEKEESCGLILDIDGVKIYHTGDTSKIDEMNALADLELDYALITMDGYYNMGPEEAMEVADIIKAKKLIPIHTDKSGDYNAENVEAFDKENKVVVKPGETIKLFKEE